MISLKWAATLVVAALAVGSLTAEAAPWTFDQGGDTLPEVSEPASADQPLLDLLIQAYRVNKDRTSIHRCLFDVSCSHFAQVAYSKYGPVVGSVLFIDRYFYRENNGARELYPTKGDQDGVFHLDDAFFLP